MRRGLTGLVLGATLFLGAGCGSSSSVSPPERTGQLEIMCERLTRAETCSSKKAAFKKAYEAARLHKSNFDSQFSRVNLVILTDTLFGRQGNWVRGAEISNDTLWVKDIFDYILVHEVSHLWYLALENKKEFEKRWKKISGGSYLGENWQEAKLTDLERVGTCYKYATRNIKEDMAKTSAQVYIAGMGVSRLIGDQKCHLMTDVIFWKLSHKIALLEEYGGISKEEADTAIARLERRIAY